MRNRDPRLIRAQAAAYRIHRDYGIARPSDNCIEDIAMAENLLIKVGALRGAEGRLIRKGKKGIVRISDSIEEPTRRKFTMSHELGHWMLHKDDSQIFLCNEGDMYDYQSNYLEVEANCFAAELLMPKRWIDDSFWQLEPSMSRIREMASFCQVSLTAAACRYVELSKQAVMVVFSNGHEVKWWRKNPKIPVWLLSKQKLSHKSYAYECFVNGYQCEAIEEVDPDAWFSHCDLGLKELQEDSIYMSNRDMLISLLWLPTWG